LPEAHRIADRIDDELGKRMEFAFSEELGFLTACPTNAGTGMRASVLVHLPVLAVTKQIDAAFRSVSQVGLHVRGMYGEGSDIVGNFFQISNQATLGRSEEDIVRSLEGVTRQIMEHEERAREALREGANSELQDKIWRAYGTLKHARLLTSEEVINLTSPLRLGVSMGIVDCVDLATLNELLVYTRPAHLQKAAEREMEAEERDYYRAAYVRERLR
jgi:protein arginine kinase